jgi:glutamate-ammonia-ligase adenylyltransferase
LPSGVQIFSLLRANPNLLTLIADLTGSAPRLARQLSARVDLLDAMLTPDFFEPLPDAEALGHEFASRLVDARDLEGMLDVCRRWAHGRQFQAGLQVLLGLSSAAQVLGALTAIAETVLEALLPTAERWLVGQHGSVPAAASSSWAWASSAPRAHHRLRPRPRLRLRRARGCGLRRPPPPARPTYYARLGQRLVSAISARTAEGQLYEIDTRLRPSGNVGPVAASLANFARYQAETAQIWEQQALTRARVVAGDRGLANRVTDVVLATLARPRDPGPLAAAVRAMRERIFREHGAKAGGAWNLKHARGGLVEVEFAAQYLVLANAHAEPRLLVTSTTAALEPPATPDSCPRATPAACATPSPSTRASPACCARHSTAASSPPRRRRASSKRWRAPRRWPSRARSRPPTSRRWRPASLPRRPACGTSSTGSARPERATMGIQRRCRSPKATPPPASTCTPTAACASAPPP